MSESNSQITDNGQPGDFENIPTTGCQEEKILKTA